MPLFRRKTSPTKQLRLAGEQLAEAQTEPVALIFCAAGHESVMSLAESRRWEDDPSDPMHEWYAAATTHEVAYPSIRICTYGIAAAFAQTIGRSVSDLADVMPPEHPVEQELARMPDDPDSGGGLRAVRLAFDGLLDTAGVDHGEYSNLPLIMSFAAGSAARLRAANEFAETLALSMPPDTVMDALRHEIFR